MNSKKIVFYLSTIIALIMLTGCFDRSTKDDVDVDTTKPTITLNGEQNITLTQNEAYAEAGATAIDDIDGNINITTTGEVDSTTVGSYTITYSAIDSSGNEAEVVRVVNIQEKTPVEETPVEETPVDETPVEETPVDETPVDETPVDETPVIQKTTITGYAEDDPMLNAKVRVTDKSNNLVVEATADVNGKYILEALFKDGEIYTLESKGKIGDRNITLHSIFAFSSDTVINANPLTELKYQLVQSGKTIDESEALIRDYFSVVSGEKLERNRFDIQSSLALGMIDLAKLYDGTLPVDAIEKIKEDILRNDGLEVKDYSYITLLQNKIALEASTSSLKLGEEVTVTVIGLTELNENYTLKWRGIPEDATDYNNSKIFTMTENAQDVYVSASLYKVDGNSSRFISSADVSINFYKELVENNFTVEDSSVDNNFSIGDSSITIFAGTVSDGSVIRVRELQTGSETSIAQFEVDAGGATEGNITFSYKYDPYLVAEPRNLQISLRSGDEVKVLKVIDIDYAKYIVRFGIPLNTEISRGIFTSRDKIIIEYQKSSPSLEDLDSFYNNYGSYIFEVAKEFEPNYYREIYGPIARLSDYGTDALVKAKLNKLLMSRENGEYKFNLLTASINNIIAWEAGKKVFEDIEDTSWKEAFISYLRCERYGEDSYDCGLFFNKYEDKIVNTNKALASWIGYVQLDKNQANLIKYGSVITKLGVAVLQVDAYGFMTELGGYVISENISDSPIVSGGYTTTTMAFDKVVRNTSNIDIVKGLGTGIAIDTAFSLWADSMKKDNAMKTAPMILPLSIYSNSAFNILTNSEYRVGNGILASMQSDFFKTIYPEGENPYNFEEPYFIEQQYVVNFSTIYRNYFNQLRWVDISPNDWEEKFYTLFFTNEVSKKQRELAYEMFKYSFGNEQSKKLFEGIKDISKIKIFTLLLEAYAILDTEVSDPYTLKGFFGGDLKKKAIKIKSEYTLEKVVLDLRDIDSYSLNRESNTNIISNLFNVVSFEILMQEAKLKLTDTQLETINIKKIRMETYGLGLEYSEDDNAWILDRSIKEQHIYEVTENINDKFTYDSELEKNVLSFATLFEGEDFTAFDNKLIGFKITLVIENSGVEKVLSKDFIFTTLADTEHLVQTDFIGATLKSSAKDASTGSPIVNAQVTLVPGGLTDFTDEEGNYEVSGLSAGNYTIIISKEGYRQVEATLTLVEDETKVYEASLVTSDEEYENTIDLANGLVVSTGEEINIPYNDNGSNCKIDFGDGEVVSLENCNGIATHTFSKEWVYNIKFYSDDNVVSNTIVTVENKDNNWIGFVSSLSSYIEDNENINDIINGDGQLYLPPSLSGKGYYWTNYRFVKPSILNTVSGDNFILEARIKAPSSEGGISCYDPTLKVIGEYGKQAWVRFMREGCTYYSSIGAVDSYDSGGSSSTVPRSDLSILGQDFSDWKTIKLEVKDNQVSAYYEGNKLYTKDYIGNVGKIHGIAQNFKGSGSIDWIKLYNKDGNLIYSENFN